MASNLDTPPVLTKPFADEGDKNIIPEAATGNQNASLEEGFPPITSQPLSQGGIPPERKDFNGLGNLLSKQFFFLQNGGNFTFNQDVSNAIGGYPQNAILQYYDSVTGDFFQVRSLINNNTYNFVTTPSYIDGVKWEKYKVPTNRNIGEFVKSTLPLTDANLHLLDGAVLEDGVYSEFISYIANLYGDGTNVPDYFCSESDWQDAVDTYGVCGKYVYDSVNNTVRLPKITGFIEGTIDPTVLGDLTEAGLPNITGDASMGEGTNYGLINSDATAPTGAFKRSTPSYSGYFNVGGQQGSVNSFALGFDASRSSSIYGNSSTVQPQSIKALYYVVIATARQTDIEIDINEIITDLNHKVSDRDLVECVVITETYHSGTDWYRVYSDGWCEQGGFLSLTTTEVNTPINFSKPFVNTNYTITTTLRNNNSNAGFVNVDNRSGMTTSGTYVRIVHKYNSACSPLGVFWEAKGYIK